jgi:hypothetical protein
MRPSLIIGWQEWIALPRLALPAVRAKVDTGARTSSLHAFEIELFKSGRRQRVRFGVHPLADDDELAVFCEADMVDLREVTSSTGHRQERVVISTPVRLGDSVWLVEVTLTDRAGMSFRMLLGRTALQGRMLVDPAGSFLHGAPHDPRQLYV